MFYIGCHMSVSDGYLKMAEKASSLGGNTLQFFTRNPRGSQAKNIDPDDMKSFMSYIASENFGKCVAHAPYILNACSADEKNRTLALDVMADDLRRMEFLPGNYYNFHPGCHVGQGVDTGITLVTDHLNKILDSEQKTVVLIETMAGKGSEIGSRFEEIRTIIDGVGLKDKLGVCLDTCHVWDAGYDIVNDLDGVLSEFDRIIGLEYLRAVHLNDSMNPCGSHKDRHQKIGDGYLGLDAFERIVNNNELHGLPFVLETPNDEDGYAHEIALLKNLVH